MGTRLSDSEQYAHLWGTRRAFRRVRRTARLQTLARHPGWRWPRAQARLGIIPVEAAAADRRARARGPARSRLHRARDPVDIALHAGPDPRACSRSCPSPPGSTSTSARPCRTSPTPGSPLVMRDVGAVVWRDLRAIEPVLLDLALEHRDTLMVGRTHGQPGAPITFGFKVASWADEMRRHIAAAGRESRSRGSSANSAVRWACWASSRARGGQLRAEFCAELGLGDPGNLVADLARSDRGIRWSARR